MPGEEEKIIFDMSYDQFSLLDKYNQRVIEPGEFDILVGASSEDIRLRGSFKY